MSDLEKIFCRGVKRFVSNNEELRKELSRITAPVVPGMQMSVKIDHLRYAAIVQAYRQAAEAKSMDPTLMIQALGCDSDADRAKCGLSPKSRGKRGADLRETDAV